MKYSYERRLSGVGGFIESIMAIIIVCCGFILLSSAISIIVCEWEIGSADRKMENVCKDVIDTITSDITAMVGKNAIDPSIRLELNDLSLETAKIHGIRVIVTEIGSGETYILFAHGNETDSQAQRYIYSEPINILVSQIEIHPGLISVIAW